MKSIHAAYVAVGATGATLAIVAMAGATAGLIDRGYDAAMTAAGPTPAALVAAAHAPGSEHAWLTRAPDARSEGAVTPTLVANTAVSTDDVRQAIATAGDAEPDNVDILRVEQIGRTVIGAPAATATALLVTARIAGSAQHPARTVRFVVDVAGGYGSAAARAL